MKTVQDCHMNMWMSLQWVPVDTSNVEHDNYDCGGLNQVWKKEFVTSEIQELNIILLCECVWEALSYDLNVSQKEERKIKD